MSNPTTIKIDSFAGIIPRTHPTLLPDGCAVKAHNCMLRSGKLSPICEPSSVTDKVIRLENGLSQISEAQSLYLWKRGDYEDFLAWGGIVNVARGNIADDSRHRIFVSGDTGIGDGLKEPCVFIASLTDNSYVRHSIVKDTLPAPEPSGAAAGGTIRYTAFYQTWVDSYGYESPASLPSDEVEYTDGDEITIAAVTSGNVPSGAVKRRIYKVVTGFETENIRYVTEQDIDETGAFLQKTNIAIKDEDTGEILPFITAPPDDLSWITYVAGGFYVGFSPSSPKTLCFSDITLPNSYPDAYRYDVNDDIIGIAVVDNTVMVMTKGYPWALTGSHPESMTQTVLSAPQACVSSRSICTMQGAVFYATQDGICMISASGLSPVVITEKYFSKKQWSDLNPSSCIMRPYDGALHCWFEPRDDVYEGYIIDLDEGVSAITTHDEQAKALCYDIEDDALYYVREV